MIADALYVVLAVHLGASPVTGNLTLANAPTLPAGLRVLTLPAAFL